MSKPTTQIDRNEAFMNALLEATTPNPFNCRERIWQMRAAFEVGIFDGSIHLGCIRSFERGKGIGSAALRWFLDLADQHGVKVRGTIKPCGIERPRLNVAQLRAWYKRHGFKVSRRLEITYERRRICAL